MRASKRASRRLNAFQRSSAESTSRRFEAYVPSRFRRFDVVSLHDSTPRADFDLKNQRKKSRICRKKSNCDNLKKRQKLKMSKFRPNFDQISTKFRKRVCFRSTAAHLRFRATLEGYKDVRAVCSCSCSRPTALCLSEQRAQACREMRVSHRITML